MNQDAVINQLAKITGKSRKQVIDTLKRMSQMPEVKEFIKKNKDDQKRRKKTS
jgi:hypothetical protein